MDKRGVVIIGSGLIARFHAQAVNASDKLELKGFCDLFSLESAKKAAAEFGGAAWGDYKDAFSAEGVNMATVATASCAHDEAVFAAAEHGVPVLVEKPLAITTARIDAMIAACRKAGVPLGCIFQTRWDEAFVDAKRRIDAGELGRITYAGIRVPWWREDDYYTKSSWHGTWAGDGGGSLINQAIHLVDWLVALMPPVREVKAFAAALAHPVETEDTVSAALRSIQSPWGSFSICHDRGLPGAREDDGSRRHEGDDRVFRRGHGDFAPRPVAVYRASEVLRGLRRFARRRHTLSDSRRGSAQIGRANRGNLQVGRSRQNGEFLI